MERLIRVIELIEKEELVELIGVDKLVELLRLEELIELVRLQEWEEKETDLLLLIKLESKKWK